MTKNYRKITLMDVAYKIYISILNDKMKKMAEKRMEEGQFGFRTRRRTTDAIFTLNYIVNRELSKNKGKIFAFFADFKAANDRVNRANLGGILREGSKRDRRRIMETYKETKNIVKVGERKSKEFWTKSRVRQGCPMSPTLFNIYIMDLEKEMKKEQTEGVVVEKQKL